MSQSVTRAAFDEAVLTGDLSTIQAYFAQPHIQEEVQATNEYVKETRPIDARRFSISDGAIPWFCRRLFLEWNDVPLLTAARHGHTHVLAWFFSREAAAILGNETLAWLLPLVAQFDGPRDDYDFGKKNDPLMLDTLLTSYVFCDLITDDHEKQRILDEIAAISKAPAVINTAIAHGARVNTAHPQIASSRGPNYAKVLEAAGAFLFGADVLDLPTRWWDHRHTSSFLAAGVDSRGAERMLLRSATNLSLTKELLSGVGFLDVDARDDALGLTALMHVANVDFRTFPHWENDMTSIAIALLEFCDVNLTDNLGRTALHIATENNPVVGVVLLENGADPTVRDEKGRTPLDLVDADFLKYNENIKLLERLLEAGVDPYAVSPDDWSDEDSEEDAVNVTLSEASGGVSDPCTFYSYLSANEHGREFIRTHAQYFPHGG